MEVVSKVPAYLDYMMLSESLTMHHYPSFSTLTAVPHPCLVALFPVGLQYEKFLIAGVLSNTFQ